MSQYYPDEVLTVPHHIPGKPSQYMTVNGVKNYQLCGYFAVAYVMQDEAGTDNIDEFLKYWEVEKPVLWKSLFNKSLGRKTSALDLKQMLDCYGACYLDVKGTSLESTALMLEMYQLIISVQIDYTGYLVGKGTLHWVVVEQVAPAAGNSAAVTLYNPFTNSMQPYGWRELMNSTGAGKYGLWVRR